MHAAVLIALALALGQPGSESAAFEGVTVSPGRHDSAVLVDSRCPTFSWAATLSARGYELAVFELSDSGDDDLQQPAIFERLPGGALSWTPGGEECLERGQRFVWFVRPLRDGASDWSQGRHFETAARPSRGDVGRALEVIQDYLGDGGSLDDLMRSEPAGPLVKSVAVGNEEARVSNEQAGRDRGEIDRSNAHGEREPGGDDLITIGKAATVPSSGLSARIGGGPSAAVRGVSTSTIGEDVAGYLGVQGAIDFDFDGVDVIGSEIGVLGVSLTNASTDNYGVVGFSAGGAISAAGLFRFVDRTTGSLAGGHVKLGTAAEAIEAVGDVSIDGALTVTDCPAGTNEVGAWCIGPTETQRNWMDANSNCWAQGKMLCPLNAILACDSQQPVGADCTATTDQGTINWIWCAEEIADGQNAFTGGLARIFAQVGINVANEANYGVKNSTFISYCCTARP